MSDSTVDVRFDTKWDVIRHRSAWRSDDGKYEVAWDEVNLPLGGRCALRNVVVLKCPERNLLMAMTGDEEEARREFGYTVRMKQMDAIFGDAVEETPEESERKRQALLAQVKEEYPFLQFP